MDLPIGDQRETPPGGVERPPKTLAEIRDELGRIRADRIDIAQPGHPADRESVSTMSGRFAESWEREFVVLGELLSATDFPWGTPAGDLLNGFAVRAMGHAGATAQTWRESATASRLDPERAAFGVTCVDCGEAVDDSRPYGNTKSGDLIHTDCGDPLADEDEGDDR